MTDSYSLVDLVEVEDAAPGNGFDDRWEARVARTALDAQETGVTYFRLLAGKRSPFMHRHRSAEEIYEVLSGTGRQKLDDEIIDVGPLTRSDCRPEPLARSRPATTPSSSSRSVRTAPATESPSTTLGEVTAARFRWCRPGCRVHPIRGRAGRISGPCRSRFFGRDIELDRIGALVMGDPAAAEGDDLLAGRAGSTVERDESLWPFSPPLVRNADHRTLEDRWMCADRLLDLDARDVLAARDDDVLASVAQLDIPVGVPDGEVTGVNQPPRNAFSVAGSSAK